MGLRDEWVPMGSEIWGRVAQTWSYGSQGWMGPYGIWDLGLNGPMVDIWDRDGIILGSDMNGFLWDLGFGVGWPQNGDMGHRDGWGPMGCGICGRVALKWMGGGGMNGFLWDVGFGVGWTKGRDMGPG